MTAQGQSRIGIMGGMFDPVHLGHLQLARAARTQLALDEVWLLPCGTPVHRPDAVAAAAERLAMLELAVAGEQGLRVDSRECHSSAPSWTYVSLAAIRNANPGATLFLLLGLDAFLQLHTWYRWRDLFTLAHLVVAGRPGYRLQTEALDPALREEVVPRLVTRLEDCDTGGTGRVLLVELDTPAVSSTAVRTALRVGADLSGMLPPAVMRHIAARRLYRKEDNN